MKRNLMTRLLRRGRNLFGKRRQKQRRMSPFFPRLEMLEDRTLLSSGLGTSILVEPVVSVSITISIQQPTVGRSAVASVSPSNSDDNGLSSLIGQLISQVSSNNSPGHSGDKALSSLLGQLNSLTSSDNTSDNAANNNSASKSTGNDNGNGNGKVLNDLLNPVGLTVGEVTRSTHAEGQSSSPALPTSSDTNPLPTSPTPQATRTTTALPLNGAGVNATFPTSLNTSLTPAVSTPDTPAPVETAPVVPSTMPEPSPATPAVPTATPVRPAVTTAVPTAAPTSSINAPTPLLHVETAAVTPATESTSFVSVAFAPTTNPSPVASPMTNAETAAVQSENAATANKAPVIDITALLFAPTANAVARTNVTPVTQTLETSTATQNLQTGRFETSLAASAISGAVFGGLENYVFEQGIEVAPQMPQPAGMIETPELRGERNEAALPIAAGETGTLVGATDEIVMQVASKTAEEFTAAAKELLTPTTNRWMRFVAPIFIAAGAYLATRLSRRKKTTERRPEIALGR